MIVYLFACPRCRQKLKAAVGLVRPRLRCPKCGSVFRLPGSARLHVWATPGAGRLELDQVMRRSGN